MPLRSALAALKVDEAAAEKAAAGLERVSMEVVEDPTEVEVNILQPELAVAEGAAWVATWAAH